MKILHYLRCPCARSNGKKYLCTLRMNITACKGYMCTRYEGTLPQVRSIYAHATKDTACKEYLCTLQRNITACKEYICTLRRNITACKEYLYTHIRSTCAYATKDTACKGYLSALQRNITACKEYLCKGYKDTQLHVRCPCVCCEGALLYG